MRNCFSKEGRSNRIAGNAGSLSEKMKENKRTLAAIAKEIVSIHLQHWNGYVAVKPAFPGSSLLL